MTRLIDKFLLLTAIRAEKNTTKNPLVKQVMAEFRHRVRAGEFDATEDPAGTRTDYEIVKQTLALAREFYAAQGYQAPEGFLFYESKHPQEQCMWALACIAQETLTGTDPEDALALILAEREEIEADGFLVGGEDD